MKEDLKQAVVLWKLEHPDYRGPDKFVRVNVLREWFGCTGSKNWQRYEKQVKNLPEKPDSRMFEMRDVLDRLDQCGLDDRERICFLLSNIYGFTYPELAVLFKISAGTMNHVMFKVKEKMR